jgi:aspartate ammonia-lyase
MFRTERDSLGEKQIPSGALYGIHALRASENFPPNSPFPIEWYEAVGLTKKSCYISYGKFLKAVEKTGKDIPLRKISDHIIENLVSAAEEVAAGNHYTDFIVPAIQGGAGTSINMNINEIIANTALLKSGNNCGDYHIIDPTEHANICQSTNDVIPTSLTLAVMKLLLDLEEHINSTRRKLEELERANRDNLRPGYTEMQEAVPSSFGLLFSTYNEALSRDWWRVSKCIERIKQVNLGGGAIGTGLSIPRYYIMDVVSELRRLTGLPISHSENLSDATSNFDKWVEIHATLKAHAVNLEKTCSDLRLLSSDLAFPKTVLLPERQVGSSIMPGKINPVIPEYVISAAHRIYSNDILIGNLSGQGSLELNPYLPAIGTALIESIKLLISCNATLTSNLLSGLNITTSGYDLLMKSPSVTTALIPYIGYHKATELAKAMKNNKANVFEANSILKVIDESKLHEIFTPGNLLKLGFSIQEL